MEKLLWEWFNKTGSLDLYLLYREFLKTQDNNEFNCKKQEQFFLSGMEEELLL